MSEQVEFVDILEPRRTQSGIFSFMTRNWHPQRTLKLDKYFTPQELKDIAANSVYLDAFIEAECSRSGKSKEKLHQEVHNYLEEMGLDKKMHVIRWMGVIFLKISFMMKIKMFVNEAAAFNLKSVMGNNPVLFLSTHRSYADFCLMTYLCYHFDIDFPAVAAGMDFYSMAVIGRRMRETCAFYIRRTLAGDPLYAATLKQYVRTVVAKHAAPIEFFLEGTRSRSNKSMPPKYGMLSMTLVPYFAHEVTDITVVPVNISYDRLMEHSLFAYEHLGVPKPKESTGGFLKALHTLNDHFGNIYINLGAPLSIREFLKNDTSHSQETLKPLDMQQLTPDQFKQVQSIADYVITLQQKNTVATISNLLSLVLMQSLMKNVPLEFEEVLQEVGWMVQELRNLGATVFENDVRSSVERILVVHRKMMRLDKERRLRLISGVLVDLSSEVKKKMKGHILQAQTMVAAVPVIQLQLYVNPILHYLVPPAIICLIVHRSATGRDRLEADYHRVRKLLSHEFFHLEKEEPNTFARAVEYCIQNSVVSYNGELYALGEDTKLQYLLKWSVWPALTSLLKCAQVMTEQSSCAHKQALKLVQQRVESERVHPYCLSLEATANCLNGLVAANALVRNKGEGDIIYELVPHTMQECNKLVSSILPTFSVDFTNNAVVVDHKALSRL
ncbi:dihydroxyacetone phosphate acyltransferase [Helicoverpa zea]|uniref:dihydroxyacetone phosphate acyltransferase n=1 Tax=Helicoverpa zea TaxID=7113 RepID=UPI001F5AEA21|nr:dihydroxyacetone phosphate acyltransferase [Helicoverpa zea]